MEVKYARIEEARQFRFRRAWLGKVELGVSYCWSEERVGEDSSLAYQELGAWLHVLQLTFAYRGQWMQYNNVVQSKVVLTLTMRGDCSDTVTW